MEDRIYDYWVATLQDGYIGNIIEIAATFGGAKSMYEQFGKHKTRLFDEVMLTDKMRRYISARWKTTSELEKEYYGMQKLGIDYVNHTDRDFPQKLLNIPSPPYGLFVKGNLPDPDKKSVAIVGARECSEYGRVCAEYFGDRLAREGIQIISGMAWGIDGISQMASVLAGGNSYGVLGCGVDVIYPRNNRKLYEKLCIDGNGVISEYAPGTLANSRGFPPRNRIISGLCDALLVVEAKAKSGTLITVNLAVEQGKCVMAVPGRITDELSYGCLSLIREGAIPATTIESVLEELNQPRERYEQLTLGFSSSEKSKAPQVFGTTSSKENQIKKEMIDALSDDEKQVFGELSLDAVTADFLAEKTAKSVSEILVILSKLDLCGLVKEIGPGAYVAEATGCIN